jgi:Na+-driven multidrug efflux pump
MFMCLLDIVFNFFLIYSVHKYSVFGTEFSIPAAGLGVYGAAIGTFLADLIVTLMLLYCLLFRSKSLKLCLDKNQGVSSYIPTKRLLLSAAKIACPVAMLHVLICGAQVTVTYIIAPLGVVALAANTFGIIIESLCYMPGHGISDAATTIVGQSLGAKRKNMAKSFAWITVSLGIVVMSLLAVVMYVFCPYFLEMMTPDKGVVELATTVIRLACFAEPFYAAYIVCFGVFLGACDTFKPAMFNLLTMWGVRIILASFIAPVYGLVGVWIAMCIELFIRGVIFLVRLHKGSWMDKYRPSETEVIN